MQQILEADPPEQLHAHPVGDTVEDFRAVPGRIDVGTVLPLEFTVDGELRPIVLPAALTVVAAETCVAAARLGLGLIQVPRHHVKGALAAGTLVSVLPDHPPSPTPVSPLYPHSWRLSPRVRVFIDWPTRELAERTQQK